MKACSEVLGHVKMSEEYSLNIFIIIYIYIYLLIDKYSIPSPKDRCTIMPRKETRTKERRKNGSEKVKPSTPTQASDARMEEEEKNRKQKEEHKKKKTGSGPPIKLPGPFGRLLRPAWIIRWAYSETPTPTSLIYSYTHKLYLIVKKGIYFSRLPLGYSTIPTLPPSRSIYSTSSVN